MNEASWDRALRVILGIVLLFVGWTGIVTGMPGTVLKIAGFLPLLTGLIGWCPAYRLFGFSTCATARTGGPTTPRPVT